jgi:glycerol uptake facilitator protein
MHMKIVSSLNQKFFAEFFGTTFLVFIGAGAAAASGFLLSVRGIGTLADFLAIALAFGLVLTVMVSIFGNISGCHLNPAITIAMAVSRRMKWSEAGIYMVAQLAGCLLGALLVGITFGSSVAATTGLGVTNFNESVISYLGATVMEAVATFLLMFVVMATAVDGRAPEGWAAFLIGITLTCAIIVLGGVTGGSLNPARTIGPVIMQLLFGGTYNGAHLLVYIIGPIVGAIAGVLAYDLVMHPAREPASAV